MINDTAEGQALWRPDDDRLRRSAVARFAESIGLPGAEYEELWRWSIEDLDRFWSQASEFLGVRWHEPPKCALGSTAMPSSHWFPGGTLSFAEHVFANRDPESVAIRFQSETRLEGEWTWRRLKSETATIRNGLLGLGVVPGDRVAGYLPNIPQTIAAFLAVASLGAVWTSVAPEFGEEATAARFRQTTPKVLLGVDGYRFKGRLITRETAGRSVAREIGAHYIRFGLLDGSGWDDCFVPSENPDLDFLPVPFDHPLWVLYSSGTTGPPKSIVHGHGGALLELLKCGVLQMDLTPEDRFFWFTTTGWVMWNVLLAPLLAGASVVLYDGHPDPDALWDLAETTEVTFFGASAAWIDGLRESGAKPCRDRDLSALRTLGSTGSPLPAQAYDWVYQAFPAETWLVSISGGTDVVTPFLGLAPTVPVYRGELGPPALGVDLQSWDDHGVHATNRVGELVIAQPMPSMPVMFWNDPEGERLRQTYYERFEGVWAHGDWITVTDRLTGVISGRSDATINRGGVRIGTAEIYHGLSGIVELQDALAIEVPRDGSVSELVLLIVAPVQEHKKEQLRQRIRTILRRNCSPRHVPDVIIYVEDLPRTATGKRLEVPVKRILMGEDPSEVVSRSSLANPEALDGIVRLYPGSP